MVVLIAALVDHFEMFCTTDQGERIGVTVREEIPWNLLCRLSEAGVSDEGVEQARRLVKDHGWAKCKYTPARGAKNLLGVYPYIWNALC